MLVKLLNDGGYGDMENVKFPVVVDGVDYKGQGCDVLGSELIRVGVTVAEHGWDQDYCYYFYYGTECEVVNEK